ncbi:hypothetical protein H8E77_21350 [bacterium]|nr:hypothetical protein [bacterium]
MQTTTHSLPRLIGDFILAQKTTDAFPTLGTGAAYSMSRICQSTTSGRHRSRWIGKSSGSNQ